MIDVSMIVMLTAFGGMLGFPKSTRETNELGVPGGRKY